MKVEITYFNKKAIVDADQVDMLLQKEAAVNELMNFDKILNTNGGCVEMGKIKKCRAKILRLNKKIRQNVQFVD